MASKPETKIVKKCMALLTTKFPGFYFKTHGGPYQKAGLPDIVGVYEGRFIGIEIKCPGKEDTLTDLQKKVLDKIKRAGGVAFMATSPQQIEIILQEELKHGKRKSRKNQEANGRKTRTVPPEK